MSQSLSPPAPPAASAEAKAPPIVGATNLLKKPAASLPMVDSNLMLKKLMEARGQYKQISAANSSHPHLPVLKELIDLLELQNSALFLFMQQQQAMLGNNDLVVKAFGQMRARQMPLEQWMQRVQDATVIMDVKVRFPEVGPISTDPFLPLPGSKMEEEQTPSQDPEEKETDDGVLTQRC